MTYEIRNNTEQGVYRLPAQFDESPLLQGYLRTYLGKVGELQDLASEVLQGLQIDFAVGVQLDEVGRRVGEERTARADEDYRIAIKTRIILNASQGTPLDILSAAKALSGSPNVNFWEHYPASLVVSVGAESFATIPNTIADELDKAAAAGVSIEQVLIDTTGDGLVFAEVVLEQGTITTNAGDDLIDQEGDFIEYQLTTRSVLNGQSAFFSEIEFSNLVSEGGDQFLLNGSEWQVVEGFADATTGNLFFEVLT